MNIYVAGAWGEQWVRARPMIAALRQASITITHDWTIDEATQCERIVKGIRGDAALSDEEALHHATLDAEGVLDADVVWLLASKAGRGSWVELGVAVGALWVRNSIAVLDQKPLIIVSGPQARSSIFTQLASRRFVADKTALAHILALSPHRGVSAPTMLAENGAAPKQTKRLQQPHTDGEHDHHIDDRANLRVDGDERVQQVEEHAHNHEHDENADHGATGSTKRAGA